VAAGGDPPFSLLILRQVEFHLESLLALSWLRRKIEISSLHFCEVQLRNLYHLAPKEYALINMLPLITRTAVPVFKASVPRTAIGARFITNLSKTAYTAKGSASGQGRNGVAKLTAEGPFEVKLAMPKSLGGSGDGQNPEQLFGESA
jgi:hypothetical protein